MSELLTTGRAAKFIGVRSADVRRWCDQGRLKSGRDHANERTIEPAHLVEFMVANFLAVPPELDAMVPPAVVVSDQGAEIIREREEAEEAAAASDIPPIVEPIGTEDPSSEATLGVPAVNPRGYDQMSFAPDIPAAERAADELEMAAVRAEISRLTIDDEPHPPEPTLARAARAKPIEVEILPPPKPPRRVRADSKPGKLREFLGPNRVKSYGERWQSGQAPLYVLVAECITLCPEFGHTLYWVLSSAGYEVRPRGVKKKTLRLAEPP